MTPTEKIYEGAKAKVEMYVDLLMNGSRFRGLVESPIEDILLRAMLAHQILEGGGTILKIKPQAVIALAGRDIRVDFLIDAGDFVCVVEADGHDFHERTKEQAARDRQRDRDLQTAGYLVLRFTGSEIYRDPWRCAEAVFDGIIGFSGARSAAETRAQRVV